MADHLVLDNPLDDSSPARQQRIRERAYHLWEADGRPQGHDLEYWERAEALLALGADPSAGQISLAADAASEVRVEEALIQDNLGEFPSLFTDQGDRRQTPAAEARPPEETAKPRRAAAKSTKGKKRTKS